MNFNAIIKIKATNSLDPDEIPKTYGPAIGLLKNVCIKKPETAKPPPNIADEISLGSLISHIILIFDVDPSLKNSIFTISLTDICTGPELIFQNTSKTAANINEINTILYLK